MDQADLLAAIDARESLEFLARMIRFKSYSGTPGESELAHFTVDAMKGLGLEAHVQPVEGDRANAIGRCRGTGGGKSLMFNGHLDTNPVTEGWTVDPLGGVYDDRFVYGIGVSNMKASDAAAFCAVKTLIDRGFYGSDAAHLLHRARMEGVVCGAGGRDNTMPDERVDVADYLDAIRIYMLALLEIADGPSPGPRG